MNIATLVNERKTFIDYSLECNRMESFKKYHFLRVREEGIKKLVSMGFFAVNNDFVIRCYYCCKDYNLEKDYLSIMKYLTIIGEEKNFDKYLTSFHQKLNPDCTLARLDDLFSQVKPISLNSFYYDRGELESFIVWPFRWLNTHTQKKKE